MGIREAILLGIIAPIVVVALARPRVGLYGYLWYALARPDLLAWVEDKYQISLILALATVVGSVRYWNRVGAVFTNPFSRWLLALQVPLALSVAFSPNPDLGLPRYTFYIRMILVLLLIPILIESESQLRTLLLVISLSLGIVGLKFGLYGVGHGGAEFVNGYGGMLGDNNFVALALAMLIPLCWYGRALTPSRSIKALLLVIACLSIPAVIMTNSRGGSLAMGLGLLLILARTKRKVASLVLLSAVLVGTISLVYNQYVTRMSTLEDYNKEASAHSRIVLAKTAIAMWKDYPLLGVGFGGLNYAALAPSYSGVDGIHVVHNSYLEMLVDSGVFAFLIYVYLFAGSVVWLRRSARATVGESQAIPLAISTSLLVFALGGYFYSWQRVDLPYILLMCCASWYNLSAVRVLEMAVPQGDRALQEA
jgi:putative inorganic carbon (HCO3(-)) transporter